ncbi:TonB-dependent receptor domain-containing protein [Pedobacter sp. L105]|uniref:TonB-dependent receptor domain-containing protein n=1 Tax=Pedobacter sp. L105 TaxID=1641871 RepID=UPI00131C05E2|nr:TonB-dependent receptor [Pedobacter sp. L105]
MKKVLLLFLCLFSLYIHSAEAQQSNVIKGIVIDSLKSQPVSYVTISLQDAKTGQQLKSTLTKDDGSFELALPAGEGFKLVIASVGYDNKTIQPILLTKHNLGNIRLKSNSKQLNEVTVSATKPIIRQEVDRISYDVQSDAESKVLTVLDMLRKVPMVSVDATDNIKLKGTGNYKILINGRESSLVAKNPSDVFKSMPASNIERIEVITTPPAKYDAEGLAGIINIITKKDIAQGYSGGVNTRYNTVFGPGINVNGTVKQGKFGLNGYIGTNVRGKRTTGYGSQNDIISPVASFLSQQGANTSSGNSSYGNAELSYEADSLNLITGSYMHSFSKNTTDGNLLSSELNGDSSPSRLYSLQNNERALYKGTDIGVNFQHGFKRNREQLLTLSYKYSLSSATQNNASAYLMDMNYNYPDAVASNYKQYNNSGSKEHTIQLDYTHPLKSLTIEAGAKGIIRKNYSDFENYNQQPGTDNYVIDPTQTNVLNYDQDVFSIYNSYQLKLKDWVMKGGLRVEHTTVDANFEDKPLDQHYNNFVPSVSVQRVLNPTNNITFGFTDRIQRPGIYQLNPFVNRTNPKYVTTGNPDLTPVTSHSFELNYSTFKKGSLTVGLNYAYSNNTIESVVNVSPDTVTTTTYANVGKSKRFGTDINANYPLTKKLNVNLNLELLRVWLTGTYLGELYDSKGFQGHAFTYTSYKFDKGYTAGINVGYDSRYVMLQGRDNDFFFYSGSASKEVLNKKGTISFGANMPFRKYKKVDFYSNTNEFRQSNYNQIYSRSFNISFNYKFGKLNGEIKKSQKQISNDDVSSGGRQ